MAVALKHGELALDGQCVAAKGSSSHRGAGSAVKGLPAHLPHDAQIHSWVALL
jgi:hypothetical protein